MPKWAAETRHPDASWPMRWLLWNNLDKFPAPLAAPLGKNGTDGFPSGSDCRRLDKSIGWPTFQTAEAVAQAYQNLYQNTDGLTDAWGRFWAEFARRHTTTTDDGESQTDPNVLGIELINEPFAGNFFANPMLAIPKVADSTNLQPAYDRVAGHIRAKSPNQIIFFAGVTWGDVHGLAESNGFDHPPGDHQFANRTVFGAHFYVPPQLEGGAAVYYENFLRKNAERLGTALFLTEFDRETSEKDFQGFESFGVSWAYWEWKTWCKDKKGPLRGEQEVRSGYNPQQALSLIMWYSYVLVYS